MRARLEALVSERERVLRQFLESEQRRIALSCHSLARAFSRGATLYAFGTGAAATDAAHVAVEFMHPVIVGKRALPAVALTNDPTGQSTTLRLARASDIALGIVHGGEDPAVTSFLEDATRQGLQTIALVGPGSAVRADELFVVPSEDPRVVQEVQETVYHVLWELVHVFFEQPGLLADTCVTCGDVAVEARVVEVDRLTAIVERGGQREEVAIELLEAVGVGDRVLCHAGVALEKLA
ncbi:SIS domain [Gaiella occulta]|uniref:SIS domain n=1 Tax=Gaiella occulta TaxID=1002870 RepID=A0A7M2Z0A7_9ACTN|nr:HypC/HybG/HupF family hydrogenase formation chaperone [Gaiella occulta]RDI75848.1 SIS domain [Gaiella occulta]